MHHAVFKDIDSLLNNIFVIDSDIEINNISDDLIKIQMIELLSKYMYNVLQIVKFMKSIDENMLTNYKYIIDKSTNVINIKLDPFYYELLSRVYMFNMNDIRKIEKEMNDIYINKLDKDQYITFGKSIKFKAGMSFDTYESIRNLLELKEIINKWCNNTSDVMIILNKLRVLSARNAYIKQVKSDLPYLLDNELKYNVSNPNIHTLRDELHAEANFIISDKCKNIKNNSTVFDIEFSKNISVIQLVPFFDGISNLLTDIYLLPGTDEQVIKSINNRAFVNNRYNYTLFKNVERIKFELTYNNHNPLLNIYINAREFKELENYGSITLPIERIDNSLYKISISNLNSGYIDIRMKPVISFFYTPYIKLNDVISVMILTDKKLDNSQRLNVINNIVNKHKDLFNKAIYTVFRFIYIKDMNKLIKLLGEYYDNIQHAQEEIGFNDVQSNSIFKDIKNLLINNSSIINKTNKRKYSEFIGFLMVLILSELFRKNIETLVDVVFDKLLEITSTKSVNSEVELNMRNNYQLSEHELSMLKNLIRNFYIELINGERRNKMYEHNNNICNFTFGKINEHVEYLIGKCSVEISLAK